MAPTPLSASPLDIVDNPIETIDVDWLVLPHGEGEPAERHVALGPAAAAEIRAALASGEFTGKRFEWLVVRLTGFRAQKAVLMGAGPAAEYAPDTARLLASAAVLQARDRRVGRLAFVHRLPEVEGGGPSRAGAAEFVQAIGEGLTLAEYDVARYKSPGRDVRTPPGALIAVAPADAGPRAALEAAVRRGRVIAHCANLARELTNEPGNVLPPRVFADRAREWLADTLLSVEVLDERQIRERGMGLVSGVGQGSHEGPRVILIRYAPAGAPERPVLGLVGKGVTFDTGGISIKTAEGMERMKDDMAGGAAVIAAMRAIALLAPKVRVVGIVVAAENMPGGGAMRPGDVIRGGSGRTVEVVNTDAEGRLLLGDGLWFARQQGATHLVDIATLTGACMVALGKSTAGVFGRPDSWRQQVLDAAARCGERCWPMPLLDDERDQLKSDIADTVNSGGRYGGAITAALFVGEFAESLPWAHVDVAGPAWATDAKPFLPKGPTGFGVRTLVELACSLEPGA